jgi:F-type H+-transporting ATPase subunit epsilon
MHLKVVTPDRIIIDEDEITEVYAKTTDGEVGILPKHVPLVTPLEISVLRYVQNGQKQTVAVMGGLLTTNGQEVSVLSDTAEKATEIDGVRAKQAKERAEARLRQKTDDIDQERAQKAFLRSLTRLKAAQLYS